jgi:putative addiction module killer protein
LLENRRSTTFNKWLRALRDGVGRGRILDRIDRLAEGNFGDAKPVGNRIIELRLVFGPGYRIYFVRVGEAVVVLLCGGDKSSQVRDIKQAQTIAQEYFE